MEVGCRGYVGSSTVRLLRNMGCTGARHRKAVKELAEEAEKEILSEPCSLIKENNKLYPERAILRKLLDET